MVGQQTLDLLIGVRIPAGQHSHLDFASVKRLQNLFFVIFGLFNSMFKGNKNTLIVCLIALVNMMGYGIVFPILYGYSKKFGLSDFENGLLFAVFSIC